MSVKLCDCGCGQPAPTAKRSNPRYGHTKGKPTRYRSGHNKRGSTRLDRYAINENGCWQWTGSIGSRGHGRAQVNGRHTVAHRAIWERRNGPVPKGLQLHHTCGDPACVNPDHLELVTPAQHRQIHAPKVTADMATAIRASGETHREVAKRFGISLQHAQAIRQGRSWREEGENR